MSKEKNTAELTLTQPGENAVAVYTDADLKSWGGNTGSANDVVIPSLHLCQQMSEFVTDGLAKMGDYVDITTKKNLGSKLKIVPFHMEKSWTVSKKGAKDKWEYVKTEKMTPETENAPYEFTDGGIVHKRVYTYRFYVLIEGELLPYTVKFKASSRNAGKQLYTEMYVKNMMRRLPPPAVTFELGSEIEKSEDGTYAVATVTPGDKTPPDKVVEAYQWLQTVRRDDVIVVDDKDF